MRMIKKSTKKEKERKRNGIWEKESETKMRKSIREKRNERCR